MFTSSSCQWRWKWPVNHSTVWVYCPKALRVRTKLDDRLQKKKNVSENVNYYNLHLKFLPLKLTSYWLLRSITIQPSLITAHHIIHDRIGILNQRPETQLFWFYLVLLYLIENKQSLQSFSEFPEMFLCFIEINILFCFVLFCFFNGLYR